MKGNGDDDDKDQQQAATGLDPVPAPDEDDPVRRENAELRDQLLRKRAEFENFRRRTERERDQIGQEKAAQVLKGLIQPIDNLERALAAAEEIVDERGAPSPRGADDSLKQGVEMILRELMGVLDANGVTVEDPVGQMFDPLRHQALSTEPVPGRPDGTIVEVYRKGYALKDRLLRPALVKVAQGAEDPESGSSDEKVH